MSNERGAILLVEDDPGIAELEKRVLSRAGWSVHPVQCVAGAVASLRKQSFRAVVLDYRLPDGDPWTVLDAAGATLPRTPVIMVTAMGSEGVAAEALQRGIAGYVKKAEAFWEELPAAVERVAHAAAIEENLHFSDSLFQLIAGNLSDVIVVGDLFGRLRYISPACENVLGYQPQELAAVWGFDLVHPDDRPLIAALLAGSGQNRQTNLSYRCRAKDGGFRWIESNINLLPDPDTGTPEVIAISRDITARKQAEEEIRNLNLQLERRLTELEDTGQALAASTRRAEEANRAKSDFLAAMSHEIRTPMNAILGMTDLLKETGLDSVQREYVDRCRRAGASLLTLINDILDLSKIESGRFELEQLPFDLEDVVERTVELIAPKAQSKGVNLFASIAPETPLGLIGDPARLRQVLINLLSNAVKFTASGQIALTVAPFGDAAAGHLCFAVSDTGIGIPANKLEAIFEDFTQAESSTTRHFGGTGLGLGIARRLVKCMGGNISVTSVVGQGSTFGFDAVFSIDAHRQPPALPVGAQDLAGRRVLIVDNNPTNCLILSRMCAGWGMLPSEAGSAAAAGLLIRNALSEQRPFSLAILDVLMPSVGGFEALAQIRSICPGLPVIMTTSNDQPGDATKARALGASALAVKPIRRAELLCLVSAALRQSVATESHAPAALAPRPSPEGAPGNPATILVAEDSEDNRFLVEVYLADQPYALQFVENGQAALDAFESQAFDLVLMDIHMPVMDGLSATGLMRAYERTNARPRTPILALTADALSGDAQRSHAAGCDGHLSKPISKEDLIAAVANFRFSADRRGSN